MSKVKVVLLLLLLLAISQSSMATTIIVDPSVYPANLTGYAQNLYDAYTQLVNQATFQLKTSGSHLIILRKSSVFDDQMIPFRVLAGVSGSLLITFEDHAPAINSIDDCSQLPTVVLTANMPTYYPDLPYPYTLFTSSFMQIASLTNFTLNGLNLKIYGDGSNAVFTNLQYFGLSNTCVQDLNPQSTSNFLIFTVSTTTNMVFYNVLFNRGTNGTIGINNVNVIKLSSVISILQSKNFTYPHFVSQVTSSVKPAILVSDFKSFCVSPNAPVLSPVVLAAAGGTFNMTGFEISDCTFSGSGSFLGYFGSVMLQTMTTVNITDVTMRNVVLSLQNEETQTSNPFAIFTVGGILGVFIRDIVIINLRATSYTQDVITSGLVQRYYTYTAGWESTTIRNVTIQNSDINGAMSVLFLANDEPKNLVENLIIDRFNVINSNLTSASLVLFSLSPRSDVIHVRNFLEHNLRRFNFTNNVLVDTQIVTYLELNSDLTIYANESVRILMDGVHFHNNVFQSTFGSDVIQMGGAQLIVKNLTMTSNRISNVVFFTNLLKTASFFLVDSTFTNNTLTRGSYIVGYTLSSTMYRILESDFYGPNGTLKGETRPFMLVNCVFSKIYLEDSCLLGSRNPMIVLQNNTFSEIYLRSSQIGNFKAYHVPVKLTTANTFITSPYVENEIFESFADLKTIFRQARAAFTEAANSAMFFLSLTENTFSGTVSTGGTSLVQIADGTENSKYIAISSNMFNGSSVSQADEFSLIKLTDTNYTIFNNNSIIGTRGSSYILSTASDSILGYLILSSNKLANFTQATGYSIHAAICGNIFIGKESFSDASIESTWLDVRCIQSAGTITLQELSFQRINISGVEKRVNTINFISISVETNVLANNVLTVADSNFSHIIFNKTKQGFIKGVFTSPMFIFTLSSMSIVFSNNTMQNLVNLPSERILSISSPDINFTHSSFNELSFFDDAGGISLLFNTAVMKSCNFTNNYGGNSYRGGLLDILNPISNVTFDLTIDDCLFQNNSGPTTSLLKVDSSSINLLVINSQFTDNVARLSSGLIAFNSLVSSNLTFRNISLNSITAIPQAFGGFIQLVDALDKVYFAFENVSLVMNSNTPGSLLTVRNGQSVTVNISNFSYSSTSRQRKADSDNNFNAQYGILDVDASNCSINNLTVSDINIYSQPLFQFYCPGTAATSNASRVNLTNSNFSNILLEHNIISVYSLTEDQPECLQEIFINNSNFDRIDSRKQPGGGIVGSYGAPLLGLNMTRNNFTNIHALNGSIYYGGAPLIFANNSVSDINVEEHGGIIYGSGYGQASTSRRILADEKASNLTVVWNNFSNITAKVGGIFYSIVPSNGTALRLQNNSVKNVTTSSKGAICFVNDTKLDISGNEFQEMQAGTDGSLVYWTRLNMNLSEFKIANDFDVPTYQVGFTPNRLLINATPTVPVYEVIYTEDQHLFLKNLTTGSISDFQFTIQVRYLDEQVNMQPHDYSVSKQLVLTFNYLNGESNVFTFPNCSNSLCQFDLSSDVELTGTAQDIVTVDMAYIADDYTVRDTFQIQLRDCVRGEVTAKLNQKCYKCTRNSYSLNPTDTSCLKCPLGAECPGGDQIITLEGYWNSPDLPERVFDCKDEKNGSRCLGFSQGCKEGFQGPNCLQCDIQNGYLSTGPGSCTKCASKREVISYGVPYLLGSILYQIYVLFTTLKENIGRIGNDEETNRQAVLPGSYILILISYTQIFSVLRQLDPGIFSWLHDVGEIFGNPNSITTSNFQCLLVLADPTEEAVTIAQKTAAFKIMLYVFSPFVKIFFLFLFELIKGLVRNEKDMSKKIITRIGMAAVVLTTLEQPGIIGALCAYLSCTQLNDLDETRHVYSSPLISCMDSSYLTFRNGMVIPALIFWGFVVPFLIVLILWFKRKKLYESDMLLTIFGGVYSKYAKKAFYWGIVTIFFKICIFVCNSVISENDQLKGVVILILIHLYFGLLIRLNPYAIKGVNRAEGIAMMTLMSTIVLILIKIGSTTGIVNSKAVDICIDVINILMIVFLVISLGKIYLGKWIVSQRRKFVQTYSKFNISLQLEW